VKHYKNTWGHSEKRHEMLTSSLVLFQDNAHLQTAACISTGNCLTILLVALTLLRANTTCLATGITIWSHRASIIVRNWWKISKRAWAYKWQTSLTKTYKNVVPDTKSASLSVVIMLRSRLSMHIFSVYNETFFLTLPVLLIVHQTLVSV
jgi:hypothetical protein